jgi:hypothetical protein
MLDGEIEIGANFIFMSHQFEKPIGEMVCFWVGIEDSDPTKPFYFDQAFQEFFYMGSIPEVSSISRGILSDQDEFLNPLICKPLGFL